MRFVQGRPEQPARDVIERAGLMRGEKPLAACRSGEGWLLGTRLALVAVGHDTVVRLPWERVDVGSWDAEQQVLTIKELGGRERTYPIEEPGRLLELLRERVTASVLLQRRVTIQGKRGYVVSARRAPGDGEVRWSVQYDDGIDPADPRVREMADASLAELAGELI